MTTNVKKLDNKLQAEFDKLDTTSAKIRFLHANGWSRGEIAKHLGKRYQHVRNVLITPLKTAS